MVNNKQINKLFSASKQLARWTVLILPISVVVGSLVAFFLWLLDLSIQTRGIHPELIYFLPFAGVFIYFLYHRFGKNSEVGNNLIIDEIHEPVGRISLRMAPLVLISTVITHLFGGSAGREGTAVQIGGSIANGLSRLVAIQREEISIVLKAGVAAGFGAVFGTPVAGAVFALEVVAIGKLNYKALIPCLMAGFLADFTCTFWGIGHTNYAIAIQNQQNAWIPELSFDLLLLLKVCLAGALFGLVSWLFSFSSHFVKDSVHRYIRQKWLIPLIGGVLVILLSMIFGADYLGLGVESLQKGGVSIVSSFTEGGSDPFSWLLKLVFTVVTLSFGFKGGEVTPLFFIGATLGNTLALLLGVPIDLLAGLGLVAVFAGATNTPIASSILGAELFGPHYILYFVVVCFMAYFFSGPKGIYRSQRKEVSKVFRKKM
jgi:H+/Cl- antiporter ClcA